MVFWGRVRKLLSQPQQLDLLQNRTVRFAVIPVAVFGPLGRQQPLRLVVADIRPWHVRFEVDGDVVEGDYVFGAVSNATSVGGVLTLDPHTVNMNDGLLELLLVKMPRNLVELSECVRALAEQRYDTDAITFRSGSHFAVTADPTMEWSLDGEWGSGAPAIHIRNLRDAICLIH